MGAAFNGSMPSSSSGGGSMRRVGSEHLLTELARSSGGRLPPSLSNALQGVVADGGVEDLIESLFTDEMHKQYSSVLSGLEGGLGGLPSVQGLPLASDAAAHDALQGGQAGAPAAVDTSSSHPPLLTSSVPTAGEHITPHPRLGTSPPLDEGGSSNGAPESSTAMAASASANASTSSAASRQDMAEAASRHDASSSASSAHDEGSEGGSSRQTDGVVAGSSTHEGSQMGAGQVALGQMGAGLGSLGSTWWSGRNHSDAGSGGSSGGNDDSGSTGGTLPPQDLLQRPKGSASPDSSNSCLSATDILQLGDELLEGV